MCFLLVPAAVWTQIAHHSVLKSLAWKVIRSVRAAGDTGWILTLRHGLEVQLATVASEPGYGAGPDLEHVDASWLEPTDDCRVGLAPDDGGVVFWLVLRAEKGHISNFNTAALSNDHKMVGALMS